MASKKAPPPSTFAGALLRAGIVSAGDAEKAHAEKQRLEEETRRARLRAAFSKGDPRAIAATLTAWPKGETFEQAIDRGNAWLDAMLEKGHGPNFGNVLERCTRCVERVGDPISDEGLAGIEGAFGFSLPHSYRRFLTTIGQVRFLNPWGDETTSPFDLVAETKRFDAEIERLAKLHPAAGQCVYTCDFHNHDAHYFLSCAERDAAGESPVHLLFHDESELYDGTFGFEAWFSEKVTRTIEEQMDRMGAS